MTTEQPDAHRVSVVLDKLRATWGITQSPLDSDDQFATLGEAVDALGEMERVFPAMLDVIEEAAKLHDEMLPHDYDPFWSELGAALERFAATAIARVEAVGSDG